MFAIYLKHAYDIYEQDSGHFADDIFKKIFVDEKVWISIQKKVCSWWSNQ